MAAGSSGSTTRRAHWRWQRPASFRSMPMGRKLAIPQHRDPGGADGLMRPAPGWGPRPGPPNGGGPDTVPWGLTVRAGRGEQANSPELSNEAVLKTDLGNHEQGRRGCSHEHLAKPSIRAMPLPWAMKPQCNQVTTVPGNNLLMQSAPANFIVARQPRTQEGGWGSHSADNRTIRAV